MISIAPVRDRLHQASGLTDILDAAYDAFEDMRPFIWCHQDPSDGMFIPFVMAATCAANGRDAALFAPSLPPRRLHPAASGEESEPGETAEAAAVTLAALCELLDTRLAEAADSAPDRGDQTACREGARCARDIHALLAGAPREPAAASASSAWSTDLAGRPGSSC